jgi:two-component system CheB/CheR fusion protein
MEQIDGVAALPEPPDGNAPALVVGLGASAGGIRALTEFFTEVPADAPFAYVVILHLSPDYESHLAEVLQRTTSLPVTQVRDTETLQARHVYVIPPKRSLRAVGETLTASEDMRFGERKAPIDIFLRTLADTYQSRAVAVILSGTGADGSSGLKRVKEHGGLTVAQEPVEAQYGEMPTQAIDTALVDYVLPAAQMPRRIQEYYRQVSSEPIRRTADPAETGDEDAIREILRLLRTRTTHDFSDYKPATVRRRIARRMSLRDMVQPAEYARFIREDPQEATALMKDLLISVTNFFRDPQAFAALEQTVIRRIVDGRESSDHVRVWSAGCATGEEAYSVAMLLAEHTTGMLTAPRVQVFATDLDEASIRSAREGLYTDADVADVAPNRVQRFFQRESGGFRVRRELREMVLFAHHNVIRDPPFSHLDLILCRNLLIYLNRASQQRLMDTFRFALRPKGYLFLGLSETADERLGLFEAVDAAAHIYQVRTTDVRPRLVTYDAHPVSLPTPLPESRPPEHVPPGDLHLRLLEKFAPPSVVVTEDYLVAHISDSAADFLRTPAGEPTRDILKLIRPELRADLRSALLIASQQKGPVDVRGARLPSHGSDSFVTIRVKPVLRDTTTPPRGYYLVLFEEEQRAAEEPAIQLPTRIEGESEQLHEELTRVNEQLRVTVERSAVQVEEAKAANEELQAINEELRSATEELETSKEELQSSNEELATVNQELKIKIDELAASNNDFLNLITSTEMGAIFLDRSLRVKLSTPRAQEVFNLRPGDIGRRLSDITNRLLYEGLYEDIETVLRHLQTVERQVETKAGDWYVVRIHPYRTTDDRIEGVALTFQDVTGRARTEEHLRLGGERFRLLIDSAVDFAIFTMDGQGRVDFWNPGAERVFGYTATEITGTDAAVLFTEEDRAAGIPQQELDRAATAGRAEDERWHVRKNGERFYCSGVTTRIGSGRHAGFAKIARDLTVQRRAEIDLQSAQTQLEDRVTQRTVQLQDEVTRRGAAQHHAMGLLGRLVTAQEDERARIARDLHDQLGQQLTALRLALERHRESHHENPADEDLDRALTLAQQVDSQVDFLAWELRPAVLDDLGLAAALPRFLKEWAAHYGITANFQETGNVPARLAPEAETTFYRVAQETLNNVAKHAHATRVDVVLEGQHDTVALVIEDDGIGFEPAAADKAATGIGMVGMQERAALIGATLQVESAPGKGTTMYLRYTINRLSSEA